MKRQYRQVLPLLTAAALASFSPMQALAENPQFAHDEATWARLQDNTMEYDELSLLVEEYNPNYQNEQASYNDTKNDDDAAEIRKDAKNSADDMYDSAEDLRDQAEDLSDQADDLSDQAEAAREAGNVALAAQLQAGAASYMAGYAPLMSAAAMTQNSALKSDISADSSYVDSDMRKIKHIKNQKGIVVSTQNLFNSYNQLRINADLIQKNVEVMEAAANAVQTQASIGMATQADVLKAQKNLQSIKSTQTETLSSLETLRQNLCMMTGWSYNAQPEIKEVPQADLAAIDQINLEADRQKALELQEKLRKNKFTLTDFYEQMAQIKNMGSLSELAGMLPGVKASDLEGASMDNGMLQQMEAIILSMTPYERENPSVLNSSRKKRIAAGSGTQVVDVNRLLKQFEMLQSLTKQFSGGKMPRNMRKLMGKKGGMMGGGMPGGFPF